MLRINDFIHDINFNSQPHKEADRIILEYDNLPPDISTHSLTRRLTINAFFDSPPGIFQLTASQGG